MSKLLAIILTTLLLFEYQLIFLAKPVFASDKCKDLSISYSPYWVPQFYPKDNGNSLTINFVVKNENIWNQLLHKQVRLHIHSGIAGLGDAFTATFVVPDPDPVPDRVNGQFKFSITINGNDIKNKQNIALLPNGTTPTGDASQHDAVLDWIPPAPAPAEWREFCSGITYQIGYPKCEIIQPKSKIEIPPYVNQIVKFHGSADMDYQLYQNPVYKNYIIISRGTFLTQTKTDHEGNGEFPSALITGSSGDTVTLNVTPPAKDMECTQEIKLNSSVPPPVHECNIYADHQPPTEGDSVSTGLVNQVSRQEFKIEFLNESGVISSFNQITDSSGIILAKLTDTIHTGNHTINIYDVGNKNKLVCTSNFLVVPSILQTNKNVPPNAGGTEIPGCGDASDPKGPAIATAIGCIHTNPSELVKDFLTFAVGISGGLAFLMMLLGAFQMLTSAGNPETLNAGRQRLTSAIIGLLFVIFSVLLLQIIGFDILQIPGFKR